MTAHPLADFIEARTGECGCPEEAYLFNRIDLTIHFEPDGDVDGFMDGGDWGEAEITIKGSSRDEGRAAIFAWATALTERPET